MQYKLKDKLKGSAKIWIIVIIVILVVGYFIFKVIFPVDVYVINAHNMELTLNIGDKLYLKKFDKDYQRGDFIVFTKKDTEFISRIIGLPLEILEIKGGKVFVNNSELDELYIKEKTYPDLKIVLKSNEYFIMGDNREKSWDSRVFGPLPIEQIIGKVLQY